MKISYGVVQNRRMHAKQGRDHQWASTAQGALTNSLIDWGMHENKPMITRGAYYHETHNHDQIINMILYVLHSPSCSNLLHFLNTNIKLTVFI